MCQSVAAPSSAEYWHIGAMTMRLGKVSGPMFNGSNNFDMRPHEVMGERL
jgi:hypothetical protein